jgi:hypothetical protein
MASEPYSLDDHRRRFALWTAGRAASTNGCRFTVEQAMSLLAATGLESVHDPGELPISAEFDGLHKEWRTVSIAQSGSLGLPGFTTGVAAKLINIYLKSMFVCGGHATHERVAALHPPIDSLLLAELARTEEDPVLKRVWSRARAMRWSKFDNTMYEEVIVAIKRKVSYPSNPLWSVERYWPGHQ